MANFKRLCLRRLQSARRGRAAALLVALAAISLMLAQTRTAQLNSPGAYAIKDAQIVTGTGKTISKGTVVVRDGLITDVGENVRVPADARIIDGAGLTVYPGFIDGYTTLGLPQPPQQQQQGGRQGGGGQPNQAAILAALQQQQGQQGSSQVGDPSKSAAEEIRPGGTSLEEARNAGITTALTTSRQGIFAGQSAIINLAGDEASKLVVRAPVTMTVQFTTGGFFGGGYPVSLMGTVSYIRQTFYDAIHYRDEVDRYNRVKRGVPRPQHDAKLAALLPVLRGDMPILFVANSDNDIRRALMIADEFKLKPIIAGGLYAYRMASTLKQKNIPVILSVDFPQPPATLPEGQEESLRVLRQRAEAPKGAAMLAQAGVKFSFTGWTLRPQDFLANVRRAVENGLSEDLALRALTANAAEILGVSEQLGTVETGKIANLVLTNGNLWSKDVKIRQVFIDGVQFEVREQAQPTQRGPGMRPQGGQGNPGAASGGVDPLGDWNLSVNSPQGAQSVKLILQRRDGVLSGSLNSPMGDAPLRDITINGNQLRAVATINMSGQSVDATVTGTIDGNSIRGSIALGAIGTFDFTGTRQPRTEGSESSEGL